MIYIVGYLMSAGLFARIIFLKVCYMKHDAICLKITGTERNFVTFVLYEYELVEKGKKVIYKSEGTTFFYPRKGKRYKVLISKKDHNKVVGYAEYIVTLCFACVPFIASTFGLIVYFMP